MNLVNKILKESEGNIFQPRRVEPREEQANLKKIELEKNIKYFLDGKLL